MACPHGFASPGSCIDCMDEGLLPPPPKPAAATVEYLFTARYPGHCDGCNTVIHEGEQTARLSDGTYVHGRCAS